MQSQFLFGQSKHFKEIISRADRFVRSEWPVLLLGETGVGKELIAQRVHAESLRSRGAFIPVNCGAMPSTLFESELFGYERGAFSGAITQSRGLVRAAHGGTLFFDEIGDLDLALQVKLLRLLDTGEVRAVGSQKIEQVDVRIIAATNVNLFEAVAKGKFRLDLLERLSVLTLNIPSLRDRKEDIALITGGILTKLNGIMDDGACQVLSTFDWPGNVRQLRNVLVRATVLGNGTVSKSIVERLLEDEKFNAKLMQSTPAFGTGNRTLADIEKEVIVERLKRYHGNRKRTAEELGIAKSTLHEKLRKWKEDGSYFDLESDSPLSVA